MCIVVADDLHHSAESGLDQTDVLLGTGIRSVSAVPDGWSRPPAGAGEPSHSAHVSHAHPEQNFADKT